MVVALALVVVIVGGVVVVVVFVIVVVVVVKRNEVLALCGARSNTTLWSLAATQMSI